MAWPRKPPKDARCDAHTGVTTDFTGMPTLIRCKNPAVETCVWGEKFEAWLCEEHADAMVEAGTVKRNPKRGG